MTDMKISVGDIFHIGKHVLLFESPFAGNRKEETKDIGFYICLDVADVSSQIPGDTYTMLQTRLGWVMRHHCCSLSQFMKSQFMRSPLYFDLNGNFRQFVQ